MDIPDATISKVAELLKQKEDIGEQMNGKLPCYKHIELFNNLSCIELDLKKIYSDWAKELKDDSEAFFFFCSKTGMYDKFNFYVKDKKIEESVTYYMIEAEKDYVDSSDEDEGELWITEGILKQCQPNLI